MRGISIFAQREMPPFIVHVPRKLHSFLVHYLDEYRIVVQTELKVAMSQTLCLSPLLERLSLDQ